MVDTVYTIGYAGFKPDEFIRTLKKYAIKVVVDVRSSPYSHYYSEYDKEKLSSVLQANGIYYRHYAAEFGARQNNSAYYPEGYLDFESFAKSAAFLAGVAKLKQGMQMNYSFVLLCSEKDPLMCHRSILVARAFHEAGLKVVHLLNETESVTQEDIEARLLEKFFPLRNQMDLFAPSCTEQDYIIEAYRKQNAAIGYHLEEA